MTNTHVVTPEQIFSHLETAINALQTAVDRAGDAGLLSRAALRRLSDAGDEICEIMHAMHEEIEGED